MTMSSTAAGTADGTRMGLRRPHPDRHSLREDDHRRTWRGVCEPPTPALGLLRASLVGKPVPPSRIRCIPGH